MKIKHIDKIITTDGAHAIRFEIYDPLQVRKLEADYQEAIDVLLKATIELININYYVSKHKKRLTPMTTAIKNNLKYVSVIEKAYSMPWEEIVKKVE